ncbi:MAG: AAA family ATPase, partial [Solirubrobacterales bacterium]|nr:AAA family ATPase [Solirubrobacterales bacterium]
MARRISSPVFVGRAAELATFDRLLEQAAVGTGGALLVAGEAGIGKSRLVAELEARADKSDALVLAGECMELAGGELAFAPIVTALRPVVDDRNAVEQLEPPLRSTLAALWPSLGETGASSREQLFEGVYRALARLAVDRPVVLIIEDLHWVDRSSRDLLAFLIRNARRDRLLLVATYRSDELHRRHPLRPFLAELERSGRAQRLELAPLGRSELAEQLAAIAEERPPGTVVEDILARSEGNPFFAEELLASADADVGRELPGSLSEALLLRIERLSAATQEVLRTAAVVGRSADHRLLGYVSSVDEAEVRGALREATENHVLVPVGRGMAYTFRHALLREAIYDDTLAAERLRLHGSIAETLSARPELATTGAAAELAYHWHVAGDLPAALKASVEAAEEAQRMHAYEESVRHVERALSLWDRVGEPEVLAGGDRFDLLLRGSQLAEWAGDARRALLLGEEARRAVDERVVPLRAAAAEMCIGRALWSAGRGDDAIEHLAAARQLVPQTPPSIERAEALAAEGRMLMLVGRFSEARDRLEEAREMAASLASPAVEASVLNSLAAVYGKDGEYERAIASGQEGLRIAMASDLRAEVMRGHVNTSQAMDDSGRLQEALGLGLEGIEAAQRLGLDRHSGDQLRVQAAWRLARLGRFSEAERVAEPAREAATTPFSVAATKLISGHLAAERGKFEVAERLLDEAWQLMQRSGGFQLIGPCAAWMTSLHLWRGQLDKARERVSDGLSRAAAKEPDLIYNAELYWLAVRVEAESDALEPAKVRALESLANMDGAIATYADDGKPPEALAFRELARAELTRLTGEPDPDLWRRAGDRFRALDERYKAAYTDFRTAEALALAEAPPNEIAEPLQAAHAAAVEIEARPFQEQVEAFARRTGATFGLEDRSDDGPSAGAEDVAELLTGRRRGPRPDRFLATVLFTDIVGSTARAAELGDHSWRDLLDRHDQIVRSEVTRSGGVVVQFVGDGSLSTFDGPGRAIGCALALREAVKALGIEIRCGVHTGEIELRGKDIGGIGVH